MRAWYFPDMKHAIAENRCKRSDFKSAETAAAKKTKILIVEDEAPVAMVIRFLLGRAGCETEIAMDISKAMQLVQEGNFDLITLDGMPGGEGFRFCGEVKQDPYLKDTPIVFVSGRATLEDQQHGLEMGADDYITKPFDSSEFARRILSHLRPGLKHG
jgi:DNA-binding response OmpR family regulator